MRYIPHQRVAQHRDIVGCRWIIPCVGIIKSFGSSEVGRLRDGQHVGIKDSPLFVGVTSDLFHVLRSEESDPETHMVKISLP